MGVVLACAMLGSMPAQGQEADDGSKPQRSSLSIGEGLVAGDLVALSLIEPEENKVELTVEAGEDANAVRDRLLAAANASPEVSALVLAEPGGVGEVLLTGKTAGRKIAVYFDTTGANVLNHDLLHRAVPADEAMIPGYVPDEGYANADYAVTVIHRAEYFLTVDPGEHRNIYATDHPALAPLETAIARRMAEIPELSADRVVAAFGETGERAIAEIRSGATS